MKMNSFSYYIWLSTVQFCHEFKINVILIVSMALGLLFPIFCLGNINVFVQNIETMRIQGGRRYNRAYFIWRGCRISGCSKSYTKRRNKVGRFCPHCVLQ